MYKMHKTKLYIIMFQGEFHVIRGNEKMYKHLLMIK